MELKRLLKLQNGSDIRGIALEGIKEERVNFTPEVALRLGQAFAAWLKEKGEGKERIRVAVGNDSRISAKKLKKAFIDGLIRSGCEVFDCGLASTPAMFMTTIAPDLKADGGVMLTASHLPFNRNGMKFFTADGGFSKEGIGELLKLASRRYLPDAEAAGSVETVDYISTYSQHLLDTIRQGADDKDHYDTPLKGMKILVDAGNGAGGFFASKVLEPLGADISGSQFLNPDGRFPNHVPNPEDGEAMASVCAAVLKQKADLGIIFDTDVDRSALVDRQGNALNRNELIALISSVVLQEHPGSVIVTDSITSTGLKQFIEENLGGVHHRFKRGYKNVINEAIRLNGENKESWLAIETSGHAALKENHFLDDGAFLVAKLLVQAARMKREGRELDSLVESLEKPAEQQEYRLAIKGKDSQDYGRKVLEDMEVRIASQEGWEKEEPNFEGLRINCRNENERGWFLLRMSLHDPLLALNIESELEGGIQNISGGLRELLKDFNKLDISVLP